MLSMKDDDSGIGGSSINGLIAGGDRNLVVDLRGTAAKLHPNIIPLVDRGFTIHKNEFLEKAIGRIQFPQVGSTAHLGSIEVHRDTISVAKIDWELAGSGQLSIPHITGLVRSAPGSTLLAQLNKGFEVKATKYDDAGSTNGGPAVRIALDANATKWQLDDIHISPATGTIVSATNSQTLTAVIYDTISGKETAPINFTLGITTGAFTIEPGWHHWNPSPVSGNLPQGTVIDLCRGIPYGGNIYQIPGSAESATVAASGGVGVSGYSTVAQARNGNAYLTATTTAYYKLSTHSTWTALPGANQNNPIANTFPEGGVTIVTGAIPVVSTNGISREISAPSCPIPTSQQGLKLFCEGKLVYEAPNVYAISNVSVNVRNSGSKRSWEIFSNAQLVVRANAVAGAPRGDEYYIANEPVCIDFTVTPDARALGYRAYMRTADWNGTNYSYGAWKLLYEGPSSNIQNWRGDTISNTNSPSTNSTSVYPGTSHLNLSFPTGTEQIDVMRGDSITVVGHNSVSGDGGGGWTNNFGRIIIPIEFHVE